MNRCIALLSLCGLAAGASAQVFEWALPMSGTWNTASNWDPAGVPGGAGTSVVISVTGSPYTVDLTSGTPTIDALTIGTSDATLAIASGQTLTVAGPFLNNGLSVVNPTNGGFGSTLRFSVPASITGSGELRLSGSGSRANLSSSIATAIVTNGPAHTISGFGNIQAALDNTGTVTADTGANVLSLRTFDKSNSGLMTATNGGTLEITTHSLDQTAGGTLLADGGTVSISSATVIGGEITNSGAPGSTVNFLTSVNIASMTLNGDTTTSSGSNLIVTSGGLTNNGQLAVNPNNGGFASQLRFEAPMTLDGTGEVRLGGSTSRAQLNSVNELATMTQTAGHTIAGYGQVNAALINNGLVAADNAGQTLTLRNFDKTNNATMMAENEGTLEILQHTLDQTGGGELVADGGSVLINNATVLGGSIVNTGSADSSVTYSGTVTTLTPSLIGDGVVPTGSVLIVSSGGMTNNGTLSVNPTNGGFASILRFDASQELSGTGDILLGGATTRAQVSSSSEKSIVTIGANHTIHGFGVVSAAMVNNGFISADVDGQTLLVSGHPKTNTRSMNAENGGTLEINNITVTQTPTAEIRGFVGSIVLNNARVNDGRVRQGPSATTLIQGTTTFDSVEITGGATINTGNTLLVEGGLNNTGTVLLNPTNGGFASTIRFDETQTIIGRGRFVMGGIGGRAVISTSSDSVLVTNGSSHTIEGMGHINAHLENRGLIEANVPSNTLDLRISSKSNTGTLRATDGGVLLTSAITVDQTGGGTYEAANGTVVFSNATVVNGSITQDETSLVSYQGTTTLDSVDFEGGEVPTGNVLALEGTPSNNGTLTINPTNGGFASLLRVNEDLTLGGEGEVVLASGSGRSVITSTDSAIVTFGPDQTLSGVGNVNAEMINRGTIAPGVGVGTINYFNDLAMTPSSTVAIELAGSGTGQFDRISSNSDIVLGGTIDLSLVDGYVPSGRTVYEVISTSGTVTGSFDAITGDDAGNGLVLKWATDGSVVQVAYTCPGDIGFPLGVADIDDVLAFLNAFANQQALADTAPPLGVFNIDDVLQFLTDFAAGCP